ncbi:MAG: hypothetical protein ACXVAM_05410 [Vulcanimicrobiaceae bacterium]
MIALAPSRGWNYQTTFNGQSLTLSLYADPQATNGVTALIGTAVLGLVPTALTSTSAAQSSLVGALGLTTSNGSYNVVSELSVSGAAPVPGSPLLIPNSLTLNQTWTPAPGATATVIAVGQVPNASACPTPASGAQVRYTYTGGYDYSISYVPGCGITDMRNNTNGADMALVSVATYSVIGELSIARHAETASYVDAAKTLMGLERNHLGGAALVKPVLIDR